MSGGNNGKVLTVNWPRFKHLAVKAITPLRSSRKLMDYFLKLVKGEKFFLCKDFDKVSKKKGRICVTIVISDHFAAKLAISTSN